MLRTSIALFLTFVCSFTSFATTWNEPWQDSIIKESESLVLAEIKKVHPTKGIKIKLIRKIAGADVPSKLKITNFNMLEICSSSGHGPEFQLEGVDKAYFFLKKQNGEYCIATPTSGFARLDAGKVYATYRHSYHQSLVSQDIYEMSMKAIFNAYHGLPVETEKIREFISSKLALKPAGMDPEQISMFFEQHAALECIYHLKLDGYYREILRFLRDTSNFHAQVSAARALSAYPTIQAKSELIKVIADPSQDPFVQAICVKTLDRLYPVELLTQISSLLPRASTEAIGFGGNIMDPRVCTSMPCVKKALGALINKLSMK